MRLGVLGGSATTGIYMVEGFTPWPARLAELTGGFSNIDLKQRGMLNISRALPLLVELPQEDIILISFAATLAWPVISPKVSQFLAPPYRHETSFHLPAYPSKTRRKRITKRLRRLLLNTVKYAAFPFGLYRPTNSLRDLEDQVKALVSLARSKSSQVVWVQHQPMRDARIWLERRMFDRYYRELIRVLKAQVDDSFRLYEFPPEFMIQENFLADEVHLSAAGHEALAEHLYKLNVFHIGQ